MRFFLSVILSFVALFLYASQNVILEQKLAKYNVFAILVYSYSVMLPLALIGFFCTKTAIYSASVPSGSVVFLIMAVGAIWFFADSAYIAAYATGGSLLTITSILVLFPAVAVVFRYFWTEGHLPNIYEVIGYVIVIIGVFFVVKGSMLNPTP